MLYFSVVDTFILRMERVAIVNKIAHWVNTSKFAQKSLRAVSDNPAFASAAVSFVAASILRPSAQAVLPIKNEQDKKYTIASSVTAGVTELITAALIFIPANKLIAKTSKQLYSTTKDTVYKENPLLLRQFKSLTSRFFKLGLMPLTSWLRFATVPLAVGLMYPDRKKKKVAVDNGKGGKLDYEG